MDDKKQTNAYEAKLTSRLCFTQRFDRLLVTTWGHDPGVIASSNILLTLNDALTHSAVLVQGHGRQAEGMVVHVPFPLDTAGGEAPSFFFK